jgi:hypothetical protein
MKLGIKRPVKKINISNSVPIIAGKMKISTAGITKKKPKKKIILYANSCPLKNKLYRGVKLLLNIIMFLTIS